MSFKHTVTPFGDFEKHSFENAQGDGFDLVPQYGACLLDLRFGGVSFLDGYKTPEELVENAWSKNIFLVPFPNRLRDGKYTHEGKNYQFDINNADSQNAIHGFCKDMPMTVDRVIVSDEQADIRCIWQHDGAHPAYPFRFYFEVNFIMTKQATWKNKVLFEVATVLANKDEVAIPAGLGWHPYFALSEKVDDTFLQMPHSQMIVVDDRLLPTGEKQPYTAFDTLKPIGETNLDNGFFITEKGSEAHVILKSKRGKLQYWQTLRNQELNFLQVFTPPHRRSIAIEPMTCNIDAFNNKDGLVVLEPDKGLYLQCGVRFTRTTNR